MSFKFNGLEKSDIQLNKDVIDVEARLKYKMLSKSGFGEERAARAELLKLFQRYDPVTSPHPGRLSLPQFIHALSEHSMSGMDDVLTALFHRYDSDDSGLLDFSEFTRGLYGIVAVPAASEECRSLCRRICEHLISQSGGEGNRALVLSLRTMDQDGNGVLSQDELCSGFVKHGVNLNPEEWNIVRKYFDRNQDGKISIEEVCHTIRGDMGQWRTQLVKYAFAHVDTDKSGSISFEELKVSYRADLHPDVLSGASQEETCLAQFIDSWVKDTDELISECEFIDYYKDISVRVASDENFLQLLKQTWRSRPGEEKVAASARTRQVQVLFDDGTTEHYNLKQSDLAQYTAVNNRAAEMELRKTGLTGIKKVKIVV